MSAEAGLRTFVVNMARDVERRQYMMGRLLELGIEAEFIAAVDGRQLAPTDRAAYDHRRSLRVYGKEMLDSEIGCYLSHRRLYERMIAEEIEVALILEDDVRIDPSFPGVVRELLACPFQDWLVIRLDSKRRQVVSPPSAKFLGTQVAAFAGGAGLYRLGTHVLGVGAYLIRREGARRMLDYGARIFMPIDQTMDRFWENGVVPYVVRPFPVRQAEDFGSHSEVDRSARRRHEQTASVKLRRRLQRMEDGVRKRAFNLRHRFARRRKHVPRGRTLAVAGLLWGLGLVQAMPADRLQFWNLTQNRVVELHLAPAGTTQWGSNQCANDPDGSVDPDERLKLRDVAAGQYDVKLTDVSGRTCTVRGVTLQAGKAYAFSISESELTDCTKARP